MEKTKSAAHRKLEFICNHQKLGLEQKLYGEQMSALRRNSYARRRKLLERGRSA
jgi:hypothetical protein